MEYICKACDQQFEKLPENEKCPLCGGVVTQSQKPESNAWRDMKYAEEKPVSER